MAQHVKLFLPHQEGTSQDLALENVSQNVEVSIFDIERRLVSTRIFNNIKEDRLRVDISTLTNGVYHVRIVTSEGTATRKVIVQN